MGKRVVRKRRAKDAEGERKCGGIKEKAIGERG
jgi:hypothetical protein